MKYGKYHCYSSYCFVYKMIIVTKVQLLSGRKLAKGARRQIVCHLIYYESENNLAHRQFMLVLQRKILISRQPSPFYYKPSITAFLLEWKFCTCNKHMAHPPKVFTTQPLSGKKIPDPCTNYFDPLLYVNKGLLHESFWWRPLWLLCSLWTGGRVGLVRRQRRCIHNVVVNVESIEDVSTIKMMDTFWKYLTGF